MEILGYFFAMVIGLVMGLIGGGGSILSVPIFTYLFGIDAMTATTLSLFVVGVTSGVGSVKSIVQKKINFRLALYFGIPSILGILFSRRIVLPNLPPYIINKWGIELTKEMFILLLFAVLMLWSSLKMIKKDRSIKKNIGKENNYTLLISQGLLVGIIMGFIGAGGGFLIVPALVMLFGMNMREAVATSLFIIMINSAVGFISSLDKIAIDWPFLLVFSGLSIIGIFIGMLIAKKMNGALLKPLFGWIVLVMGIWIIIKELFLP